MVIGVTGKTCSGKDFICRILRVYGFQEINADQIGHQALLYKEKEVTDSFITEDIFDFATKKINRKKLGAFVFRNPLALHKLEEILHPIIHRIVSEAIKEPERDFMINAAVLEKIQLHTLCEKIIWVEAPCFLRYWRARKRERISFREFRRRNWNQRSISRTRLLAQNIPLLTVRNWGLSAESNHYRVQSVLMDFLNLPSNSERTLS